MDRSMSLTTYAGASTGLSIVGAPTPVPRVSLLVPVRRHLPGILSSSPPNPRRARIRTPVRSQPALFPFRKARRVKLWSLVNAFLRDKPAAGRAVVAMADGVKALHSPAASERREYGRVI